MLERMITFALVTVVLVTLALFSPGHCQEACRAQDGKEGTPGVRGRDGWPGQKGQKGEAVSSPQREAVALDSPKGEQGSRGLPGDMGPRGYSGQLGEQGPLGPSGRLGPPGTGGEFLPQTQRSAFSIIRVKKTSPRYDTPLNFDQSIINKNNDFDLQSGLFTCKVPGVYYFVFHAMSGGSLCLALRSSAQENNEGLKLGFCDYNSRGSTHTLTAGAVLQLKTDQKVWLEPFKDTERPSFEVNTLTQSQDRTVVFNGFLLFS